MLIPVVDHGDEATVILTKRTEKLRKHSGQVAFPGGRIDRHDRLAGSRRAARDGRGDRPRRGAHRGRSAACRTMSPAAAIGSRRSSAIVRPGFELDDQRGRGRRRFRGAAALPDGSRATTRRTAAIWNGQEWFFYDMPYGGQRIWGMTAGIIRTLYERLYA